MEKRDEYVEKMKTQLDQWNAEIAKWEAKADIAQAEARVEFNKRLEAVRQQREQALVQLRLMQGAAGDAWMEMMKGTDQAWASMREAFDKASSHFRGK